MVFTLCFVFRKNVPRMLLSPPPNVLGFFFYCIFHILSRSLHGARGSSHPALLSPLLPQLPPHAPPRALEHVFHSEHWHLCPGCGKGAATGVSCRTLDVLEPHAIIVRVGWALGIRALSKWGMDPVSLTAEFWWVLGSSVVGTPGSQPGFASQAWVGWL